MTFDQDLVPAYSREAEMALLGSCLLSERASAEAKSMLSDEQFYVPAHRYIFASICELLDAGTGIEYLTVADKLRSKGRMADCGGEDYLVDLAGYPPGPSGSKYYADIIIEKWQRRKLGELSARALVADENLETLFIEIESIKGARSGGELRSGMIGDFAGGARKKGVYSGFRFVDDNTVTRGFPEGQMSVVSAYTGTGKTAFMLQCAYNCASLGDPVCFATFADMSGRDLADRLVKNICGWSHEPPADHPDLEAYHAAVKEVKDLPLYIYDATEMRTGRDIETFAEWFRAEYRPRRFRKSYLDYAQEIRSSKKSARTALEQADEVASVIRWLAAETMRPMIVGSQITEGNKKEGTRDMTKGSRVWEEKTGFLLRIRSLEDDELMKVSGPYQGMKGLTAVHLAKNRFGKKNLKEFWQWQEATAKFVELG